MRALNYRQIGIAAGGGMSLIVAGILSLYGCNDESPIPVIAERPTEDAWQSAQPSLAEADSDMEKIADRDVKAIDDFFVTIQGQSGIAQFVEEVLSGGTKINMVTLVGDAKTAYFAALFDKTVISKQQLSDTLQTIAAAYLAELAARDNKLLVDLQADTEVSADSGTAITLASAELDEQFSEIYQSAYAAASADFGPEALRQGLNVVVMNQANNAASAFLASSGLADENGRTNYWLSVIAGGLAGTLVDKEVRDLTKPRGELMAEIQGSLNQLRDCAKKSLRNCLHDLARQHSIARRQLLAQTYGVTL